MANYFVDFVAFADLVDIFYSQLRHKLLNLGFYNKSFLRFSLGSVPILRQSIRIISIVSMQLRTMQYPFPECNFPFVSLKKFLVSDFFPFVSLVGLVGCRRQLADANRPPELRATQILERQNLELMCCISYVHDMHILQNLKEK